MATPQQRLAVRGEAAASGSAGRPARGAGPSAAARGGSLPSRWWCCRSFVRVKGMSGQAGSGGGGGRAGPPPFKSPSTDGKRQNTRFKDEDEYVEVMLDVWGDGDAVAVRRFKGVVPDAQEAALLERPLAPGPGGLSSKLRALKRITSGNRNTSKRGAVPLSALLRGDRTARLDRSVTGASSALRGLQFLNQAVVTEGWPQVEKRFHRLVVDGFLLRCHFG